MWLGRGFGIHFKPSGSIIPIIFPQVFQTSVYSRFSISWYEPHTLLCRNLDPDLLEIIGIWWVLMGQLNLIIGRMRVCNGRGVMTIRWALFPKNM